MRPLPQDPELQPAPVHPRPRLRRPAVSPSAVSTPEPRLPLVLHRAQWAVPSAPARPTASPAGTAPGPVARGRGGGRASPLALVDLEQIAKRPAFPLFVPSEITRASLVRLSPCSCVLHPRRAPCAACGRCVEGTALLVPLALEGQCEHCEPLRRNQMCVSEVTG